MFISNICLISQIFPKEFQRPLLGPDGLSRRGAQPCQPPSPRRCCSPYPSARKCKRDLGIFPLHSFLISVCVSAGILLLSNTLEFGSIYARVLLPTATAIPLSLLVTVASEPSHNHTGQNHTVPNLSPLPVLWARAHAHTCTHNHSFGCQSSPIPGVSVRQLGHAWRHWKLIICSCLEETFGWYFLSMYCDQRGPTFSY